MSGHEPPSAESIDELRLRLERQLLSIDEAIATASEGRKNFESMIDEDSPVEMFNATLRNSLENINRFTKHLYQLRQRVYQELNALQKH
ncbi:hypothetical protein [Natronoglycomyces albus]|uniref:Uncharacterized protein n=1 Tax=Natronoglycomyces albus TaxID=2811108 RepID=A0A895XNK1_9ACTN|nr:hypothetical protein [Natronoglycomyces albus]QSB05123.1 hypothetical protein JQS30_15400 [Natronoglycomyces albus]